MLNLVAHIRYYANVLVGVVGVSVLVQGVLLVNLWNLRQRFRGRRDGYDDKGFELPRDALGAVLRRGTAAYSVEVTRRSVARGRAYVSRAVPGSAPAPHRSVTFDLPRARPLVSYDADDEAPAATPRSRPRSHSSVS